MIAADISMAMLAVARRELSHPRISYQLIGTDQRIGVAPDSIDAALSCFVFVTIMDVGIIRVIVEEVFRTLLSGAVYAVLEVNPDTFGVPFALAR